VLKHMLNEKLSESKEEIQEMTNFGVCNQLRKTSVSILSRKMYIPI